MPAIARATAVFRTQEFGIVADGRTNDLPALRKILAEAETKGRGVLKLPAGRLWLDPGPEKTGLVIPANVRIEGMGKDETTLVMADGAYAHVVSAPYGWVQIADLTVDGNEQKRVGAGGHNIRVTGDKIRIERLRVINSVWYGIAISQRRYARDVVIDDVEIINAGSDGIDIKNRFGRTEDVLIQNVTVRGFGRPEYSLPPHLVGSKEDHRRNKAGVDLRGRCNVKGLVIDGILVDRDGLRFRHGEATADHRTSGGAHGSTASRVDVRGTPGQSKTNGIAVFARDVALEDVEVKDVAIAIEVGAAGLVATRGHISRSNLSFRSFAAFGAPGSLAIRQFQFARDAAFIVKDQQTRFEQCSFLDCDQRLQKELERNDRIALIDCRFEQSC